MEQNIKPDKKYLKVSFWIHLTVMFLLVLVTVIINVIINPAGNDSNAVNIIWLICFGLNIILWIIVFPLIRWWIKNLSYSIGEERITIYKGIIIKTQQNIPYRAITDFALKRGPYDRILGIGSIKIQTAGQTSNPTGYEGSLSGLIDYENMMAELRAKIKALHPVSEALTVSEPSGSADKDVLSHVLAEVRRIREMMEKKKDF